MTDIGLRSCSEPLLVFQRNSGKRRDNKTKIVLSIARMTYTKLPPRRLYSLEIANNEVVDAGPMARATDDRL